MRIDAGSHLLEADLSGSGPPDILCLHGLADTRAIWDPIAPELKRMGRVVRLDQRGHGDSTAPPGPYRRDDLAEDVRCVLDALGIQRAILVGHSMGGIVAMTAALRFPDRVLGLVLLGTASQCSQKAAAWYEQIAGDAELRGLDGLREAIFGARSRRNLRGDPRGIAAITRCLKSLHDEPLTPHLRSLSCPALLMVGTKDPMGSVASSILAREIPSATLEVVPERGHWLHVDDPGAVSAAVRRFLVTHQRALGISPSGRV